MVMTTGGTGGTGGGRGLYIDRMQAAMHDKPMFRYVICLDDLLIGDTPPSLDMPPSFPSNYDYARLCAA